MQQVISHNIRGVVEKVRYFLWGLAFHAAKYFIE
jgi:hypothetical protein